MSERPGVYRVKMSSEPERVLETQLFVAGIEGWQREYRFHPVRKWRFDVAWVDAKLAVEIEGGSWAQGRHTRGAGFEQDCLKYDEAVLLGWRILRFTSGQVQDGTAIRYIETALK